MADLKLFAKCGFAILVVVSLGILIERLTSTRDLRGDDYQHRIQLDNGTVSPTDDISDIIYNKQFEKCLRDHSKSYHYPIIHAKHVSQLCSEGRCIHDFLIDTTTFLSDSFNIMLQLIEPSLLFCLLPSARKYNLLTRGFISSEVRGFRNVVTFGLHYPEAAILDDVATRKKLISNDYRIFKYQRRMNAHLNNEFSTDVSHYLLVRYSMMIHIVVFYPRSTFSFSFSFPLHSDEIDLKGLLYGNDRAFENFTTSVEYLDTLSSAPILLPSDPRFFLLDMMSSQFLECNSATSTVLPNGKAEVLMALKELKSVLSSQMVVLWLWSKSLQGWFEKCDIQHYSAEVQFSVSAKSVEGFNFSALFQNSHCQYVESHSNFTNNIRYVELNCFEVPIRLIFMYEDNTSTYSHEHIVGQNIFKLTFPKFSLCATDVYGLKVNVPCETGDILDSEYGQFLKNTTLNLQPEKMKNVLLLGTL